MEKHDELSRRMDSLNGELKSVKETMTEILKTLTQLRVEQKSKLTEEEEDKDGSVVSYDSEDNSDLIALKDEEEISSYSLKNTGCNLENQIIKGGFARLREDEGEVVYKPLIVVRILNQTLTVSEHEFQANCSSNQQNITPKLPLYSIIGNLSYKMMRRMIKPQSYFVNFYSNIRVFRCAHKLFDKSLEPDLVCSSVVLSVYSYWYCKPPKPPDYAYISTLSQANAYSPTSDNTHSCTPNSLRSIIFLLYVPFNNHNRPVANDKKPNQTLQETYNPQLKIIKLCSNKCEAPDWNEQNSTKREWVIAKGISASEMRCSSKISKAYPELELAVWVQNGHGEDVLFLDESIGMPNKVHNNDIIINMVKHVVLSCFSEVYTSSKAYLLHHKALNFMLIGLLGPRKSVSFVALMVVSIVLGYFINSSDEAADINFYILLNLSHYRKGILLEYVRNDISDLCEEARYLVFDRYVKLLIAMFITCRNGVPDGESRRLDMRTQLDKFLTKIRDVSRDGTNNVRVQQEGDVLKQYQRRSLGWLFVVRENEVMDAYLPHIKPLIAKWEEFFMLSFPTEVLKKQPLILHNSVSEKEGIGFAKRQCTNILAAYLNWIGVPVIKQLEDERVKLVKVKWVGSLADQPVKASPKSKFAAKQEVTTSRHNNCVANIRKHFDVIYDLDEVESLTVVKGLGTIDYREKIQNGRGPVTSNQKIATTHLLDHKQWVLVLQLYFTKGKQSTFESWVQESRTDLENNSSQVYHDMQSLGWLIENYWGEQMYTYLSRVNLLITRWEYEIRDVSLAKRQCMTKPVSYIIWTGVASSKKREDKMGNSGSLDDHVDWAIEVEAKEKKLLNTKTFILVMKIRSEIVNFFIGYGFKKVECIIEGSIWLEFDYLKQRSNKWASYNP